MGAGRLAAALARVTGAAREGERGSAVVEFVFLGTVLLVPVVYLVITVGQVQAASFAVVGAADQAVKVLAAAGSLDAGTASAEQAVAVAVGDHGFAPENTEVRVSCSSSPCLQPGSTVTVTVELGVPLPWLPRIGGSPTSVAAVSSEATQVIGRFS